MAIDFNESTELPRFIHKPHESQPHTWGIYEYKAYKGPKGGYDQIGDYRLLNTAENPEITEKMLKNICTVMNGKNRMESFENLNGSRILFNIKPGETENSPTVIVFREHDGQGVSTENAIMTIEKGVFE